VGSALLAVHALLGAVALAATVPSGFVDSIFVGVPIGAYLIQRIRPETFRRVCMSFDAWVVGFGLSALLQSLGVVESNLAFLVLFAVGIVDSLLLYRFFTVQLPGVKRVEQLAASDSPAGAYAHRAPAPKKAGHYA